MNTKSIEEKTFDLLEATGLNWTVLKEPLVSGVDGKKTTSFGLFRKDTGLHLSTVTKRYTILQNHEVAQALIEATEKVNLEATRGGQLDSGKRIYIQAALPDEFVGKSALQRWLTGLNVHGGESAAFGSTDTVVVCRNTFYRAYAQSTKFRHTASIQERVDEFVKGIRIALGFEARQLKVFKTMADVPLKDDIFANIMKACFDVDVNENTDKISTQQKNKLTKVSESIETELNTQGPTVWGLFNGITRYTNHVAGARRVATAEGSRLKTPEELLTYVMAGEGYETNLKAYRTIHDWLIEQKLIEPETVLS